MAKQITIEKSAAAPATVAKKTTAKPAAKPAAKTTAKPAAKTTAKPAAKKATAKPAAAKKTTAKPAITHIIADYARPSAGNRLAAFTSAWLDLTGLNDGKAIKRAELVRIAGPRAVQYHTGNGNMESTAEGVVLTARGASAFGSRTIDPEIKRAYIEALTTGTQSDIVAKDAAAYEKI